MIGTARAIIGAGRLLSGLPHNPNKRDMIYITILLFAALVFKCWKRRRDSFPKPMAAYSLGALNLPPRNLDRVRLAILTNRETGETFDLFDDNRDDAKLTSGDWTCQPCNQADPSNRFKRD